MTDPPRPAPREPVARLQAALWAAFVALLLWLPGGDGPSRLPFAELLEALAEAGGDKVVHGALFAVQAWLLCRCRGSAVGSAAGWGGACFALAAGFGALTEAGQLLVAGRDAGLPDALANTAGAALGVALYAWRERRAG